MSKLFLSVVIPSYDEMANLQKGVLDKVEHYLGKQDFDYEVIIVDDGSTDGSREFVRRFVEEDNNFRILENEHLGKAGAVTAGVLSSHGEYVLFTDMDQATPIEELEKLLPYVNKTMPAGRQEADIIIGSRNRTRKGAPFTRQIMANAAIILRSLLIGLPEIKDTQCGFKLFSKKAAWDIFTKLRDVHKGFSAIKGSSVTAGFDMEILYLGKKLGYKIVEVPVDWLYVETRRVNPIRDSIEGVMDLIKIKRNIIRGVYK